MSARKFEAQGFVSKFERLLVIADESPNGRFASRIAGILAGARGLPVDLLPPSAPSRSKSKQEPKPRNGKTAERVEEAVKGQPKITHSRIGRRTGSGSTSPSESTTSRPRKRSPRRPQGLRPARTRCREHARPATASFIRMSPTSPRPSKDRSHWSRRDGVHLREPERSPLRILVPVNGTDVSRRAAEVAITIARASGSAITVLYVATTGVSNGRNRKRRGFRASRREQAIVKDIVEIGQPVRRNDCDARARRRSPR